MEWVAGSSWNQWPDVHGMGGRMTVESAARETEILGALPWLESAFQKSLTSV
ncbi:Aryl-phospho-beta-D-glucosidase BglC [Pseudomonas syringae pv. actinidiae]|uniref:Aryl-phospho-beta-D-glucosidase BglC n=1 Tax=Pseudomonas syringae pv. actinidiae TaxID=103796 RepID=A0A2V0QDX0_PSESF|nr:Aryl-phospho-beta-D-glucosidase BglC [Pseudomonas syringae pv. actinidiae]